MLLSQRASDGLTAWEHPPQELFKHCKRLFAVLPLAACIAGATLVLHGGQLRHTCIVQFVQSCMLLLTLLPGAKCCCIIVSGLQLVRRRSVPEACSGGARQEAEAEGSVTGQCGAGVFERPAAQHKRRHGPCGCGMCAYACPRFACRCFQVMRLAAAGSHTSDGQRA